MILKFIREYRVILAIYLLLAMSFSGLFFLYRLPIPFLVNTLLFSVAVFVLLLALLFKNFYTRMKIIQHYYVHEEDFTQLTSPVDLAYLDLMDKEKQEVKEKLLHYKNQEEDLQAIVKMWSHQMKVPLAALSLMSQTNQLHQADVNHQLMRLDRYMDNLLNYLKLTNYASDFRFEKVAVEGIVVELVKKYRQQFLQKKIGIQIAGQWELKTDRKWLLFALSQVIDNALKYTKAEGSITITLQDGIEIQDTGIGILEEDIPRLCDEGFTGYNGREHQKATGFGLYLTKRILTQLELDIVIESQVGVGTSVRISTSASS